ncbi:uncharacterized protein RCC_08636 [Ramularia collo-cygni]|uniref:Heterokaryon incompatibility domain-containing protein n=1 Tax=Ramularia collo-cygni TaxID=112498 RepID=A0A2D3VMR1_9PEZI|nr:uncharacterized protein RCC_08636 [Ramularia collo-cygni]CZT22928.1 uncharacterized protein RCC_08636 [Ramularia collo-cygni]
MNITRWKSPPTGLDLPDFHYTRLKGRNSIRLLKLLPGTGNKAISITLIDSYIGQSSYDALSYTWGDGQPDKTIFCNGRRLLITQTLLEALRHFRDSDREIILWIDQVCIWQGSISEKNQQVQLMGKIFKSARKVTVWLGDHADNSRAGMQLAYQLLDISTRHSVLNSDQLETLGLPKRGSKRWISLAAILRRPWFSRTWIVQEVVLNPNVEVVLGDSSLQWDEFEKVVCLLEGPTSEQWQLDPTLSAWELPFSRINRIRRRHQRYLAHGANQSGTGGTSPGGEDEYPSADVREGFIDLLDLLVMARGLGATDPRDKVYALLGLSTSDVAPDYTLSPAMIFNEFAMHILGEMTRLGTKISSSAKEARQILVLLACAGGGRRSLEQSFPDDSTNTLDLPSWVPDWTSPLLARPFVFDSRFRAGGDTLEVDWNHETGYLQLCGKLIDTIEVVGTVMLDYTPDSPVSDAHRKIDQWWQESLLIVGSRTVRSPGSTMNVDAFKGLGRDLEICKHGYYASGCGQTRDAITDNIDSKRRRSLLDDTDIYQDAIHSAQHTLALGPTSGRVLFLTTTGYIGLAPYGTRAGDLIHVVLGAGVPYCLRPQPDNVGFELIGEAYVQGIMQGEALEMDDWAGFVDVCIR